MPPLRANAQVVRTDYTLFHHLSLIWREHFSDVERVNPVVIEFGRAARTRLGSITLDKPSNISRITISHLLAYDLVPDVVLNATIAHELVHYTHGFSSLRPRIFRHPHQGGIILKEFRARGLYPTHLEARRWLRANWRKIVV